MNRRGFVGGFVASSVVLVVGGQGAFARPTSTPKARSEETDFFWEFVNNETEPKQYIVVERYVFESEDEAEEAVFGDEPIESKVSPIENTSVVGRGYSSVRAKTLQGNLWKQDIEVNQVSFVAGSSAWLVTIDSTEPALIDKRMPDTEVLEIVIDSILEFDKPVLPREWELSESGEIE